ncbi:MAG TPA: STAS domain-containing protein [Gemmataceae bacterium]|nr:STAS domain-containing protein [Gemmataceae bacterium]
MPEQPFKHISCPVVVLRIEPSQLLGDVIAEALREEFLTACQGVGAHHVVVDFQAVAYLSSASFRPLLSLLREVRAHNGRLVLCNLQPDVHEIFMVTRLISSHGSAPAAFEVQANVATAVASLHTCAPKS